MFPFTLDGEAVVCGPDGIAIFDALHRHGTVTEAMLYAFDLLELDGEDLRDLPLGAAEKGRGQAAPRHRAERARRRRRHSPTAASSVAPAGSTAAQKAYNPERRRRNGWRLRADNPLLNDVFPGTSRGAQCSASGAEAGERTVLFSL
jgi:hypothetical protein